MNYDNAQYFGLDVQIGTGRLGMKPLTQAGFLVIDENILYLHDLKEQLVASAPLEQCNLIESRLTKLSGGTSIFLEINGIKYSVGVGHNNFDPGHSSFQRQKEGTKNFIIAFSELKSNLDEE